MHHFACSLRAICRQIFKRVVAIGCLSALSGTSLAAELAIVIDDIGYDKQRGQRAIALPDAVSLAVLPFAPNTQTLLQLAAHTDKDILIHLPMQPQPSAHARIEHDTLTQDMTGAEFDAHLSRAFAAVPQSIGLSNHTGSLLTAQRRPMQRLMQHLRNQKLMFLDSRTTAATVALEVALASGVAALKRDVFLDHDASFKGIQDAFARAIALARRQGAAVAVGHPYETTLTFLETTLMRLPADIRLVPVASLAKVSRRVAAVQQPNRVSPHISLGR